MTSLQFQIPSEFFLGKGLFRLVTEDSWGVRRTQVVEFLFNGLPEAETEMIKQLYTGFVDHITGFGRGRYIAVAYILDHKQVVKTMNLADFENQYGKK